MWCFFKGIGKSLQTVLLDVGENGMFGWNRLLERSLYAYAWEEILVVCSHRGGHVSIQDKRLSPNDSFSSGIVRYHFCSHILLKSH